MKALKFLIETIYWAQIFLCPTLIIGFIGFISYYKVSGNVGLFLFVLLSVIGAALGIYFAERVRKTVGCSMFVSRIFASPEIDNIGNDSGSRSSNSNAEK